MDPVPIIQTVSAIPAANLGWLHLFLQAHLVVKLVMIGLLAVSVWSWSIIIEKQLFINRVFKSANKFEQEFWTGRSLDELYDNLIRMPNHHGMVALFVAAMREWKRSNRNDGSILLGLQLRVEKVMNVTAAREVERLEDRLLFLATVGSTAPFIGLFGTVWGIMDNFQAIAASGNANLAVVAPGIAEALFATALGLLAAIPAVIFYNKFSGASNRYAMHLERFSEEFSAILSRHIDEKRVQ